MIQRDTSVSAEGNTFNAPFTLFPIEDQPVPLVRISTCGGLRVEVLQHPAASLSQAQYGPPSSKLFGRGSFPAQILLKHLVSAPNHYRTVDWLYEHWHEIDEDHIPSRMDNRVSFLRGMLCPPFLQGEQRDICRKQLVSLVEGSKTSGNGYRLGAYPLIWIDVDALDWNVQQACRMERYGDDALPFWERAYYLASQGAYLPEEIYSDWTEPRRLEVMGALRQSVHSLKRLYLARYGEHGQAEVMRMLQNYLLQFPTDEDALRMHMELLGQQERFQEIQQMFERTKRCVEEEGGTLDARTLDLQAYLYVKQLRRQGMRTSLEVRNGKRNEQAAHRTRISHSFVQAIAEGVSEGIVKAMARIEQREAQEAINLDENELYNY